MQSAERQSLPVTLGDLELVPIRDDFEKKLSLQINHPRQFSVA